MKSIYILAFFSFGASILCADLWHVIGSCDSARCSVKNIYDPKCKFVHQEAWLQDYQPIVRISRVECVPNVNETGKYQWMNQTDDGVTVWECYDPQCTSCNIQEVRPATGPPTKSASCPQETFEYITTYIPDVHDFFYQQTDPNKNWYIKVTYGEDALAYFPHMAKFFGGSCIAIRCNNASSITKYKSEVVMLSGRAYCVNPSESIDTLKKNAQCLQL